MSSNKLEMSLDDIIKANKNKDKSNRFPKNGKRVRNNRVFKKNQKARRRIQNRRSIITNIENRRKNNKNINRNFQANNRNNSKNNKAKATTVATKKLVQRLVKKALAQRNFTSENVRPINRKFGGIHIVKKSLALNRLNARSRVINRIRNNIGMVRQIPVRQIRQTAIRQVRPLQTRRQITYNTLPASSTIQYAPISFQKKYLQRQRKVQRIQPVIVQEQVQTRRHNPHLYQFVQMPNRENSVRSQIQAMRRQVFYINTQQNRPIRQNRMQQQNRQIRQNRMPRQQNRKLQQQRVRFVNRQHNPFYEPQNFLQRIPVEMVSNYNL